MASLAGSIPPLGDSAKCCALALQPRPSSYMQQTVSSHWMPEVPSIKIHWSIDGNFTMHCRTTWP